MPTLPFLLQAAASADTRFVDWFVRLLPIIISAYALFSGRSREERKAHDKLLADLALFKETQQARNTNFQLEIEKLGTDMMHRHQEHTTKIEALLQMQIDMATMKETLRNIEHLLRK
jgi:hypothetical protein